MCICGIQQREENQSHGFWKWLTGVLNKILSRKGTNPDVPELGIYWNQWEQEWCESLKWNRNRLCSFWEEYVKGSQRRDWKQQPKKALTGIWSGSEEELDRQTSLFLFYIMFRDAYTTAFQKKSKNRDLNFKLKKRFIWPLNFAVCAQIELTVLQLLFGYYSTDQIVYIEALVLSIMVLSSIIITKTLDVNKYQETWSRHTCFQYLRDQEMLHYMLNMEPYKKGECANNVDCFVKAILEIEARNIAKFCDNMDTKEKGMLEEVLALIQKKK